MKRLNKKLISLFSCMVLMASSALVYAEDTDNAIIGGADGPTDIRLTEEAFVSDVVTPDVPQEFTLQVDKELLKGDKVQPLVIEGRSLVPFRVLFGALGAEVEYDAAQKTIAAKLEDKDILLTVGSNVATVNGSEVTLLASPTINNETAYIPVRDIGNITGREVEYSSIMKKINVYDVDKFIEEIDSNFTIYNEILKNSSADQLNKTFKSTVNLAGDVEVYDLETENKKFSGEVNFEGLTRGMDLNGAFEVKFNLKDFEKDLTAMDVSMDDLQLIKDILASKHQVIMDSKKSVLYLKSDAVSTIMEEEKDTWFKIDAGNSLNSITSLYSGQLGALLNNPQESSMGKILYESTKMQQEMFAEQGIAEYMPSVYDQMDMTDKMMQLMIGDDGFAKSGSTYTMSLDKEGLKTRIAKFFPEAAHEMNAMFLDVESLNYKMVLADTDTKDPKVEMLINGKIKDGSNGIIDFNMDIKGTGNPNSTINASLTIPKFGKVKLDMTAKSSETNQTINLAPPQSAKIKDLI